MADKKKLTCVAILLLSVSLAAVAGAYVGLKTGQMYERNNENAGTVPRLRNLVWSMKEAAGLVRFHSQSGQDRWVVHYAFPGVRDGYYVDVGSGHGVEQSNTKVLEDLGWSGICIDPFPSGMENRTCQIFKEVVYSEAGKKVSFKLAGGFGGIEETIGRHKKIKIVEGAETVELTTTTLDDILARANAPSFIHYISIDIEGAELEALKGLSLSKYKVGAFTIEHNYEEPKRTEIGQWLQSRGYRLVRSLSQDDCYILNELERIGSMAFTPDRLAARPARRPCLAAGALRLPWDVPFRGAKSGAVGRAAPGDPTAPAYPRGLGVFRPG